MRISRSSDGRVFIVNQNFTNIWSVISLITYLKRDKDFGKTISFSNNAIIFSGPQRPTVGQDIFGTTQLNMLRDYHVYSRQERNNLAAMIRDKWNVYVYNRSKEIERKHLKDMNMTKAIYIHRNSV